MTGTYVLHILVGGLGIVSGFLALYTAKGARLHKGFAFPFFMFATVGILGGLGDFRVLRRGPLRGARRLARHLWRMCFALFIAALSFFIGQADVFPPPIRIRPLLGLPVLGVLVTMFYWLWRVRIRQSLRGIVEIGTPDAARTL